MNQKQGAFCGAKSLEFWISGLNSQNSLIFNVFVQQKSLAYNHYHGKTTTGSFTGTKCKSSTNSVQNTGFWSLILIKNFRLLTLGDRISYQKWHSGLTTFSPLREWISGFSLHSMNTDPCLIIFAKIFLKRTLFFDKWWIPQSF